MSTHEPQPADDPTATRVLPQPVAPSTDAPSTDPVPTDAPTHELRVPGETRDRVRSGVTDVVAGARRTTSGWMSQARRELARRTPNERAQLAIVCALVLAAIVMFVVAATSPS